MIRCLTLFDITRSSDHNSNQIKNWHTIIQALGLKSILTIHSYPKKVFRNIDGLEFGKNYIGNHNVWIFDFELENFNNNLEEICYMVDLIPMIQGLEESVKNLKNYTIADGENKNICFLLL